MWSLIRVLAAAGFVGIFGHDCCNAQFVEVSPHVMTFEATADALIPTDDSPAQFIGIAAGPLGIDHVPFKLKEIRPENLPSGAATNFVVVSPSAGVATATSIIALNPKVVPYMLSGFYQVTVLFENPDNPAAGADGPFVYLRLKFQGVPEIASVVNAASLEPGISPGQLVTIRGAHLSTPPLIGEADSAGLFPTVLGHSRVTFNGIPAPLLYVSNNQINCVVPHGVAGSQTAQVIVERPRPSGNTDASPAVTVPVTDTSPAIFTADQSGSGPGAIVNTGAGTGFNTEGNPAPKGTAITFYATGAGTWNVPYPDGSLVLSVVLALPTLPKFLAPVAPVSVTIGGQSANVIRAAAQRNRVSGMLEVTAEVPLGISSGAQPLVLKVAANDNAQQNVAVWVR